MKQEANNMRVALPEQIRKHSVRHTHKRQHRSETDFEWLAKRAPTIRSDNFILLKMKIFDFKMQLRLLLRAYVFFSFLPHIFSVCVCVCVWLNAYVARARRLWSLWHHICMLLWASPYLCAFAFLWLEILLWFSCSLSLSLFLLLNSIGSCSNLGRCTSHNGSLTLYQAVFSTCIFRSLVFRFPGCAVLTHHFLAGDIKLFYGRPNVVVIEINACSLLLICLSTSLILSHRTFNLRLCFKQICAVFFFSSPLSLLLFTTFDPIGSCGYSRWIKRDEHDQDFVSAFY